MDITDIMVYVHPDFSSEQRVTIEAAVSAHDGVMSVHFSPHHVHELTVAYNPEVINSEAILGQVRQWDKVATMVGL